MSNRNPTFSSLASLSFSPPSLSLSRLRSALCISYSLLVVSRALSPSPPIIHKREKLSSLSLSLSSCSLSTFFLIRTHETLTNTLPMIYSAVSEERRILSFASISRSVLLFHSILSELPFLTPFPFSASGLSLSFSLDVFSSGRNRAPAVILHRAANIGRRWKRR